MRESRLTAVDLFSGCGGLSMGVSQAGVHVLAAADVWKPAMKVYAANFDHPLYEMDLGDVVAASGLVEKYRPDMVIGGPPCQAISGAGHRDEDAGTAYLVVSFAETVAKSRPRYFVMENVERLVRIRKFKEAMDIFRSAGYGVTVRLLDASLCGAPQKRKRYFVVGALGGDDDGLSPYYDRAMRKEPMTMREYFGDELGTDYYYRHPRSYSRRAIYGMDEPHPTVRGTNRPISANYAFHHGDATSDFSKARHLTFEERSRVQTFPAGFKLVGTKTDLEQMIGNAVPVKLAEFVGKALIAYDADHPRQA